MIPGRARPCEEQAQITVKMLDAFHGTLRIAACLCENESALKNGLRMKGEAFGSKIPCTPCMSIAAAMSATSVSAWPEMLDQQACWMAGLVP